MTQPRRVNRGPRAAAENRAALIAAAREVFAELGFDAPLNLVARRAGVGQGSLYRHFPDRESIALAVFEENIAELEELAAAPESTLMSVLTVMVDQLIASIGFIAVLNPASVAGPRLSVPNERVQALLAGKLERARAAGEIRRDVTTADLVLALGMLAGMLGSIDAAARPAAGLRAWELLRGGLDPRETPS